MGKLTSISHGVLKLLHYATNLLSTATATLVAAQCHLLNSLTAIGPYMAQRFFWALFKVNNFSNFLSVDYF